MKGIVVASIVGLGVLAGGAVLIHLHATNPHAVHPHDAAAGVESDATRRALDRVAAIGPRWDAAAFAETVSLYSTVHRDIDWPGVLEPETIRYGGDERQTFRLFRPEQGFSEPGPVFVFLHGNGLGNSDQIAPGSDGLIYSHVGKLAATFGGIGITMNYRNDADATLAPGAEDLRLVLEWTIGHIAPYGGDPGTIVLLANSEGATRAAAYLFNENLQMPSGPGIAAAILTSGLFGQLAPEISESLSAYHGERVPLALWAAEYDTPAVADGIADLHAQLCRKYEDCPWFEQIAGHNHVSHLMSLGTSDTSVQSSLIRFYHTVR